MDKSAFLQSLHSDEAPVHASLYVQALWYDAKGNWEKAHEIIQDIPGVKAARIHAYLHRKEGDAFNANYWYQRAHSKRPTMTPDKEWEKLLDALL